MNNIEIIYEDKQIIVCRKPAGIPTQTPTLGQQDMVSLLKNYRAMKKEEPYIGIIHRLDQPVEGVMLFAKNKETAAALSKQVAERDFGKEYYAVVEGVPKEKNGSLENWLLRDGKTNTSRVVEPQTAQAKEARLEYEVIETVEKDDMKKSLLHVILHTGRHHQIRVQLSAAGYPIVGDRKYGKTIPKGYEPLSLCSCRIRFLHPKTKKIMDFRIQPVGKQFSLFSHKI